MDPLKIQKKARTQAIYFITIILYNSTMLKVFNERVKKVNNTNARQKVLQKLWHKHVMGEGIRL